MATGTCSVPELISTLNAEAVVEAVERIPEILTPLVLVAESESCDFGALGDALAHSGRSFFGGMFPKLVFGDRLVDEGAIVFGLHSKFDPIIVDGLNSGEIDFAPLPEPSEVSGCTLLVFVDGLSTHIGKFLRGLYARYGTDVLYCGGGAGSLSLEPGPCLFATNGPDQGAATVVVIPGSIGLGVQHGWRRLMGPVIATDVDNTVIRQINWRPAFDVYREVVEPAAGVTLQPENFFEIAKAFPFGLEKSGGEDVVRDPIIVRDDGALVCVGEIPQNGILHLLQGDSEGLIAAAGRAAELGVERAATNVTQCLLFDCISRVLYLEDRFSEEITAIRSRTSGEGGGRELIGVLSLGEISSIGDGYLEFLNKTTVVACLESDAD